MADARVSQVVAETLTLIPPPSARVSQLVVETLTLIPPPSAQVTQLVVEVLSEYVAVTERSDTFLWYPV